MSDLGAFVPHAPLGTYRTPVQGPLNGLTLAVKDLYDVAGLATGGGTPAWLEGPGSEPAEEDAPAVAALLDAGAQLVGKTITDELAWSLNGENAHYGTPENPAAPGRIPGGSSAGSAAATAGGLCDIGLGSDTGGSVRLPASYCGIWGLRPTHGAIPLEGIVPLAPSYDTVGWFARDAATLAKVGGVFFSKAPPLVPSRILIARDLFADVVPEHAAALSGAGADLARRLAEMTGARVEEAALSASGLGPWREAFRICQSAEVWETHGAWVEASRPDFGPGIAERFAMAKALDETEIAEARAVRAQIAARLYEMAADTVMVVPGAGSPPPQRGLTGPALDDIRARALEVLCPSGHAGLPQLALPALTTEEGPIGLGLIAAQGTDAGLLALAKQMEAP